MQELYSPKHFTLLWDVTGTITQLSSPYHLSSSHYHIYYLCSLVLNEVNSSQTATFTPKASSFLLSTRVLLCQMHSSVHSNGLHELYSIMKEQNSLSTAPCNSEWKHSKRNIHPLGSYIHAVLEHLTKLSLALHTRNSCKMLKEKSLFRVQLECAFLA